MTELQRIKIALKTLTSLGTARNQEEIGKLLGYSNKSSFSQVINGIVNLPSDFIERLCGLNPLLNKDWIKTGNGNILLENSSSSQTNNKELHSEKTDIINNKYSNNQSLPLISAETLIEYNAGNKEIIKQTADQFLIPTFRGADYLITVIGNSMYPNYNNGDIVACKHLSLDTFFQWNKVYILNTEQGILVKRVKQSPNDDYITIISDNKDYDSFELPKSKLLSIAIVTGIIRVE